MKSTDLFIISVKDDFILEVIKHIKDTKTPIIHTSGSVDVNVFSRHESYGVLYPIQTFSKNTSLSFE